MFYYDYYYDYDIHHWLRRMDAPVTRVSDIIPPKRTHFHPDLE